MYRIKLTAVLASVLMFAGAGWVHAQEYPSKPIRVIVAYAAGGAADMIVRAVFDQLKERGYQAVIENRPGGGTQIAAAAVAKSDPDGYTLFATGMETFAISPFIHAKLSYDPVKDFKPVSGLAYANQILAVPAKSDIKSVSDVIEKAKAKQGALNYGTIGMGGSAHINMVLFENLAGVKLAPVHYRGGAPMLNDLVGGHVPLGFLSVTLLAQHIKAGTLRGLGVGSKSRIPQLPDIPTIDESGVPGFEAVSWFGLFAPQRTPDSIVEKLNADIQKVFAEPDFRAKFLDPNFLGVIGGKPAEFQAYIDAEADKWKKVIESANLKIN